MPTFNQGIRTKAGDDLFSRVDSGKTKITYTRIVFSSMDLSSNSDDEIRNLTDIEPQELSTRPQVIDKSGNSNNSHNPETEIRGIVNNETLTSGLFIKTYGLYAMDDDNREILYGVSVDDHPSYLPAFTPNERPQQITYNWDTAISDTNDVNFTDTNNAYVTYTDLNSQSSNTNSLITSNASSISASASQSTSTLSASAAYGIGSNAEQLSATNSSVSSNENNLQQQISSNKNNILFDNNSQMLPGGYDLNNLLKAGCYVYKRPLTNAPDFARGNNAGYVRVFAYQFDFIQVLVDTWSNMAAYRANANGGWKSWERIITSDDFNNLQNQIDDKQKQLSINFNREQSDNSTLQNQLNSNQLFDNNARHATDISQDANDWTTPGKYYVFNGDTQLKNWPFGNVGAQILVKSYNIDLTQVVHSTWGDETLGYRSMSGDQWHDWVIVANKNDIKKVTSNVNLAATNALNQANANMETNRSNLQGQINSINSSKLFDWNSSYFPKSSDVNNLTDPGCYVYNQGLTNGPSFSQGNDAGYIRVYSFAFDTKQVVTSTWQDITAYRTHANSKWYPWHVVRGVDTADNEGDAQNKSNQTPGELFIYPD